MLTPVLPILVNSSRIVLSISFCLLYESGFVTYPFCRGYAL